MVASQEANCRRDTKEGARASGKAQPPPILPACAILVFVDIAILLKLIGKVSGVSLPHKLLGISLCLLLSACSTPPRLQAQMCPTTTGGALVKRNGP